MKYGLYLFLVFVCCLANLSFALTGSGVPGDPYVIGSVADLNIITSDSGYWDDVLQLGVDLDCPVRVCVGTQRGPDGEAAGRVVGNPFRGRSAATVPASLRRFAHCGCGAAIGVRSPAEVPRPSRRSSGRLRHRRCDPGSDGQRRWWAARL